MASTYLQITTRIGLPGFNGFVVVGMVAILSNFLIADFLKPVHFLMISTAVPGHYHTTTEPEIAYIRHLALIDYASANETTPEAILSTIAFDQIAHRLPRAETYQEKLSNPTQYFEWRKKKEVENLFGPLRFEEGMKSMRNVGFWIALVCSYACWIFTMFIAKRIRATEQPLKIAALWSIDVFSSVLLSIVAVYLTLTYLRLSDVAGNEYYYVMVLSWFWITMYVWCSTLTHLAIGAIGIVLVTLEFGRRLLALSINNVVDSSNSAISSMLLLVGAVVTVVGMLLSRP
jgi:hypothetical protein